MAALAAQMRAHGARVGLGEVLAAQRALAAVDASSRAESFYALRAALCSTRAELVAFASAFMAVFGAEETTSPLDELGEIAKQALPRVAVPEQGDEAPAIDLTPTPAAWSEEELLREKDFARYTDAERAMARRLLARIALKGPKRLSRRTVPTTRRRDTHDLRATIRASLRHRRRAARAPLPRAGDAPAAARADLRRERLDGALQRACSCSTCRRAWPPARASRRSCSGRG